MQSYDDICLIPKIWADSFPSRLPQTLPRTHPIPNSTIRTWTSTWARCGLNAQ